MAITVDRSEAAIRPIRPDEVETIAEIAVRAWEPIFRERAEVLGEDLMRRNSGGDWREAKANAIRKHCEWDLETVFVTELGGQVVGFITFAPFREKGIIEIGNNAIDPDYQGHGLGSAQYQHVLDWARGEGLRYAKVMTGLDDCHAAARAAYEKVGFDRGVPSITYYMEL